MEQDLKSPSPVTQETLNNSEGAHLWSLEAKAEHPQKNPTLPSRSQPTVQKKKVQKEGGSTALGVRKLDLAMPLVHQGALDKPFHLSALVSSPD